MDDSDPGIVDCLRRLRELAADVMATTVTLHEVQLQIRLDAAQLAHMLTRHSDRRDIDECLLRLSSLSAATAAASHAIADAQRHMQLELALIGSHHHRRLDTATTTIPWTRATTSR